MACHPPAVPLPPKFYELRDSWIIYNNTKAFCISGEWDLRPANQRGQDLMSFIERLKPWYTENVFEPLFKKELNQKLNGKLPVSVSVKGIPPFIHEAIFGSLSDKKITSNTQLAQIFGKELKSQFVQGSEARVVTLDEYPATVTYNEKTTATKISFYYCVINHAGRYIWPKYPNKPFETVYYSNGY